MKWHEEEEGPEAPIDLFQLWETQYPTYKRLNK